MSSSHREGTALGGRPHSGPSPICNAKLQINWHGGTNIDTSQFRERVISLHLLLNISVKIIRNISLFVQNNRNII